MSAPGPFHSGEVLVQRSAGVEQEAQAVGRIVDSVISPAVRRFLAVQRMAVAASLDEDGRPWASLLTGSPGFLQPLDDHLVRIVTVPASDDPLATNLLARPELALLVLDPRTRQRVRLNGRGLRASADIFLLTDQVYGNCPKYIQKRRLASEVPGPRGYASQSRHLDARQRAWIARADTLFIASFHPAGGADASHRGGNPGFVRVLDARRLALPDYPGNNMFNSLGNVAVYPRAGLLFVDFESGDLLQLTGSAELRLRSERELIFEVEAALATLGGSPLRWELLEYSPANP